MKAEFSFAYFKFHAFIPLQNIYDLLAAYSTFQ